MTTPGVSVVIPVRNRRDFTQACLESLAAQTLPHTTVVVDDGSTDGTPEMVRERFPDVVLLRGGGDLWWTGATNLGVAWVLRHCRAADLVVTLNDDTLLPPEYLERLTSPAYGRPRALFGSVAVRAEEPDVILDGGTRIDWWRAKAVGTRRGDRLRTAFPHGGLHPVDVLSGCGTLVPVRAFLELGPYNARRLPHYGADWEFSRRAARAGYDLLLNADAVLARRSSTGLHADVASGGLTTLVRSLTSRRSATNLAARVNFALLAAPRRAVLPYLGCDLGRVVLGSLRRYLTQTPLD